MANQWKPVEILLDQPIAQPTTSTPVLPESQQLSTPLALYERARALIAKGWIKYAEAVTEEGAHCQPWDERAAKWCVIGTWKAVTHFEPDTVPHDYMYKYMNSLWNTANLNHMITMQHPNPPQLNDSPVTEHALIVRCFDKVIAHLIKHPESNAWYPREKPKAKTK